MTTLFNEDQLRELLAQEEFRSFDDLLYGASLFTSKGMPFPAIWTDLAQDDFIKGNISKCWICEAIKFSAVTSMLERKVQQFVVAKHKGIYKYSLLYFFLQKGKLRPWIGHMPLYELPPIFSSLTVDISPLYKVHNGFYNLEFGEPGFLPVQKVEIYKDVAKPEYKGFLKLFQQGTSDMGIDLDSEDNRAYIIFGSDEEVEEVESIWTELDRWLANIIEEYDDVIR